MKKKILIVGITLVLLAVGLSGCNEKSIDGLGKSDEEKILGRWLVEVAGAEETAIINFFSNGSFSMSARDAFWGTYVITDETLAMDVKGDTIAWEYSFSNNDKKLTLIDPEGESPYWVLTKQ